MFETTKVHNNNIAFELYKVYQGNDLEYAYRGVVNADVVENILSLGEDSLGNIKEQMLIKKRVYFVMVECLQNITRHQDIENNPDLDTAGMFIFKRNKYGYSITSANLILDTAIDNLREKIEIVNSKNADELKEYSRQVLGNGTFGVRGGAGLGLIEMARKSGSKFKYRFIPQKHGFSTFYITIDIPTQKGCNVSEGTNEEILDKIQSFHNMLQVNTVVLSYCGTLSQNSLKNLLNIISLQINASKQMKSRMNIVIVELLQNLLAKADRINNETATSCFGLFHVRQDNDHVKVSAANYIKNENIAKVSRIIDEVNRSNKEQRKEMLLECIESQSNIINIVNKSHHNCDYVISKIDDRISLFSLSAYIDKDDDRDITLKEK